MALERLGEASAALVQGARRALPAWAEREAARLLCAWGRLGGAAGEASARAAVLRAAAGAGAEAARRVADELAALFALDPDDQRATPLEVVRGAVVELTAVLAAAGLPDVVRDEFEERAFPHDRFGLVPRSFRDVDPDLAAVHFAWGVAKAAVLRVRHR